MLFVFELDPDFDIYVCVPLDWKYVQVATISPIFLFFIFQQQCFKQND